MRRNPNHLKRAVIGVGLTGALGLGGFAAHEVLSSSAAHHENVETNGVIPSQLTNNWLQLYYTTKSAIEEKRLTGGGSPDSTKVAHLWVSQTIPNQENNTTSFYTINASYPDSDNSVPGSSEFSVAVYQTQGVDAKEPTKGSEPIYSFSLGKDKHGMWRASVNEGGTTTNYATDSNLPGYQVINDISSPVFHSVATVLGDISSMESGLIPQTVLNPTQAASGGISNV